MSTAAMPASDGELLISHVRGLFDAFLRGDRETIRRGHSADWTGFQIPSRKLVRGIDEYMESVDAVLGSIPVSRYELLDTDVQVHGDLAIVYYIAREWLSGEGAGRTFLTRAVDVYRREPTGWIQCGSNVCVLPEDPPVAA